MRKRLGPSFVVAAILSACTTAPSREAEQPPLTQEAQLPQLDCRKPSIGHWVCYFGPANLSFYQIKTQARLYLTGRLEAANVATCRDDVSITQFKEAAVPPPGTPTANCEVLKINNFEGQNAKTVVQELDHGLTPAKFYRYTLKAGVTIGDGVIEKFCIGEMCVSK